MEMTENTALAFQQYDYVRFNFPDLNGVARGRTVPGRHAGRFLHTGIGMYKGKGSV